MGSISAFIVLVGENNYDDLKASNRKRSTN